MYLVDLYLSIYAGWLSKSEMDVDCQVRIVDCHRSYDVDPQVHIKDY